MARKLQTVSAALVAGIVNERCPELAEAYNSITKAERLKATGRDAVKAAKEQAKLAGLDDESLFAKVKRAGIEAAKANLPGGSVMGFWDYQNEQAGLKANTGKSYARLVGYISDAVQAKEFTEDEILAATRPELQEMFASDDAKARTAVRKKTGELVKGASAEDCTDLLAYIEAWIAPSIKAKTDETQH